MKILIPIDASERSKNAAFWATGNPALFGKDPEIHIFYAQEPASDRIRFATDPETLDEFYREEGIASQAICSLTGLYEASMQVGGGCSGCGVQK